MNSDDRATILRRLDEVTRGVPYSHDRVCHLLFDLVMTFESPTVVEVAYAYGKATAYLASAAQAVRGQLHAVDRVEPQHLGRTAQDLLAALDLETSCTLAKGEDARWYLVDLVRNRVPFLDLVYIDASHTLEVDGFLVFAAWAYLKPGGILVLDDLDWVPAQHATDLGTFSRPSTAHIQELYSMVCRLPDVESFLTWGEREVEWTWGLIRKSGGDSSLADLMNSLLSVAGDS
ncbi:class I SAM-dependent methyltransferase [Pseudofrankia sp. DC12]|uniref:class I SAM-dependent methyltransferase n=1 Tax=Pseudofrankia sp. DC12 TaxID=683315 RepID=UPI0012F7CF90|nr:class I SAM-dependent methyltransferase [Pseudofrankia sp. DC12]